jgi:hypothetical protein
MKKIFSILICLNTIGSIAQLEQIYFFAGIGPTYYQGDLNSKVIPPLDAINFSFKGGVGYHINNKFGITAHYAKSSLSASDLNSNNAVKVARGISFTSPLSEIGLNFKIRDILGVSSEYINYVLFGANYFEFSPKNSISDFAYNPQPFETNYSTSGVNLPLGVGFGVWLVENLRVVWETSVHLTFTDFIDGVSKSGNSFYNDTFIDSHIIFLYSFSEPLAQKDKYQKKYR